MFIISQLFIATKDHCETLRRKNGPDWLKKLALTGDETDSERVEEKKTQINYLNPFSENYSDKNDVEKEDIHKQVDSSIKKDIIEKNLDEDEENKVDASVIKRSESTEEESVDGIFSRASLVAATEVNYGEFSGNKTF